MTIFKIECNGQLINTHSRGHGGRWSNPIDFIPPIGSIIEYNTFDSPSCKCGEGVLTKYKVVGLRFSTKEDFNNTYEDKECIVEVLEVSY